MWDLFEGQVLVSLMQGFLLQFWVCFNLWGHRTFHPLFYTEGERRRPTCSVWLCSLCGSIVCVTFGHLEVCVLNLKGLFWNWSPVCASCSFHTFAFQPADRDVFVTLFSCLLVTWTSLRDTAGRCSMWSKPLVCCSSVKLQCLLPASCDISGHINIHLLLNYSRKFY